MTSFLIFPHVKQLESRVERLVKYVFIRKPIAAVYKLSLKIHVCTQINTYSFTCYVKINM